MTKSEKFDDMIGCWLTLYDRLENGETPEEINIDLDIVGAGRGWHKDFRQNLRDGLEMVKQLRDECGGRDELLRGLKAVKAKYLAGTLED
jgi:hypothetical protein